MKTYSKLLLLTVISLTFNFAYSQITLGPNAGHSAVDSSGIYIGTSAGHHDTGSKSIFTGYQAGYYSQGNYNLFSGYRAGYKNSGAYNIFQGFYAGNNANSGSYNLFLGYRSGRLNKAGHNNIFLGRDAGYYNNSGSSNIFLGQFSGFKARTGNSNVYIGYKTGYNNVNGSGNVFIGPYAGYSSTESNKLEINNSTGTPLIWGDFSAKQVVLNSKVGIQTNTFPTSVGGLSVANYTLFVKGGLLSEEVRVNSSGWADYVFDTDYNLMPLKDVSEFIKENQHLPNMPSEEEVNAQGINVAEMTKMQQEKIEELTLYIIEQEARIKKLEELIYNQKN